MATIVMPGISEEELFGLLAQVEEEASREGFTSRELAAAMGWSEWKTRRTIWKLVQAGLYGRWSWCGRGSTRRRSGSGGPG